MHVNFVYVCVCAKSNKNKNSNENGVGVGVGVGVGLEGEVADRVLSAVGLGRWQFPHLATLILVQALRSLHLSCSPLMNPIVDFRCSPSSLPLTPSPLPTVNVITTNSINNKSGMYDNKCLDEKDVHNLWGNTTTTTLLSNNNNNNTVPLGPPSCPYVDYNDDIFQATVTSQWDLVCEREHLQPLFQLTFTLGSVFSSILGGDLSDRFGRKTVLCVSALVMLPTTLASTFTTSFPLLLFLRFLFGATTSISYVAVYTLIVEVFPPQYRAVAQGSSLSFGAAIIAMGGVGYLLTAWRPLMLSFCVPAVLLIPPAFMMSWSPRWLVRRGRGREAAEVLRKAAKLNKVNPSQPVLQSVLTKLGEVTETKHEVVSQSGEVMECLRNPAMRTILLFTPCIGFSLQALWLGTAFSANSFTSTNPQLYILCIGVSQTIGSGLAIALNRSVNRRVLLGGGFMLVAFLLIIILTVSQGLWGVRWCLVMASHLIVATCYETSVLYTMELMPTFFRSRGGCYVHFFYLVGEGFMTLLAHVLTKQVGWWSVNVTLCVLAVLGSLTVIPLPETRNKPLPETLHDITKRSAREKKIPVEC
ncbi:hypothetical protein Pmani_014103 [Petrolisthes manimaculis]|uniref:Major facilitator superfamily (MFS) profile domain-containing protein n=1 Tax=Petrolisthes manimaculis TaxID=1843537 RepID=A0AAE1UCY3_9EUCA|nr:hypothetical protein Pmani_014103 [Petrolisthes manimaculis]